MIVNRISGDQWKQLVVAKTQFSLINQQLADVISHCGQKKNQRYKIGTECKIYNWIICYLSRESMDAIETVVTCNDQNEWRHWHKARLNAFIFTLYIQLVVIVFFVYSCSFFFLFAFCLLQNARIRLKFNAIASEL